MATEKHCQNKTLCVRTEILLSVDGLWVTCRPSKSAS